MKKYLDKTLEYVLIIFMALMVINITWQVLSRFLAQWEVIDAASSASEELARFFLVWIGLLGAAYATGKNMHLAIDLLPNSLSGQRKKNLNMIIHAIVFLFALVVLTLGGIFLTKLTFDLKQTSPVLFMPLGYLYMAVPISGLITAFYSLWNMFEAKNN
ncbi:MAG: TRAP transporter small permease [Bacteroidia bacterium]|nr:TRAP transporter small permease [Bacteroidia bacterium]